MQGLLRERAPAAQVIAGPRRHLHDTHQLIVAGVEQLAQQLLQAGVGHGLGALTPVPLPPALAVGANVRAAIGAR